jgi:Methyltransferase domain
MSDTGYWNVAAPGSLPTRVARYQRRRMFRAFLDHLAPSAGDTVADVGVTSDRQHDHSNYFEAWYPDKSQITAIGIEDASFLETAYPGVAFIRASGTALPFADGSFDFVHSSAVIEHAGSFAQQTKLLSEIWRVARRGVFITTPNRWFPIELHTVLPFLHYLPPQQYRAILRKMGFGFFAEEKNLNLMSGQTLSAAAKNAGLTNFSVHSARLLGLTSNLLLVAKKSSSKLNSGR